MLIPLLNLTYFFVGQLWKSSRTAEDLWYFVEKMLIKYLKNDDVDEDSDE